MIKTYRKKPMEFKAVQWTGENLKECMDFCEGRLSFATKHYKDLINSSDKKMIVGVNNYIVKGKSGELFVYSSSVFKDFFDEVKE